MKKQTIFSFENQDLSNEILIKVKSIFDNLIHYLMNQKVIDMGTDLNTHMIQVNQKLLQYKQLENYLYEGFFEIRNIEDIDGKIRQLTQAIDKINIKLQGSSSDLKVA